MELTQRELKSFKNQLNVRTVALWNSQNSTLAELDKLKAEWTEINTTVEKTSNFPDKVGYGYCEHIHLCDNELNVLYSFLYISVKKGQEQDHSIFIDS